MTATDLRPAIDAQLRQLLTSMATGCPGLMGALLADAQGQVLAACGNLVQETALAGAGSLLPQLNDQLSLACTGRVQEALIWTDTGPWYLCQLGGQAHALVLKAGHMAHAAMLRHAGLLAAQDIAPLLRRRAVR